jgi:hypothetical protein
MIASGLGRTLMRDDVSSAAAWLKERHQRFRALYPLLRRWFASAGSAADGSASE